MFYFLFVLGTFLKAFSQVTNVQVSSSQRISQALFEAPQASMGALEKSFGKASSHHIFVILPFVLEQSQTNDVFVFHNFMGSTVHVVFKLKLLYDPVLVLGNAFSKIIPK